MENLSEKRLRKAYVVPEPGKLTITVWDNETKDVITLTTDRVLPEITTEPLNEREKNLLDIKHGFLSYYEQSKPEDKEIIEQATNNVEPDKTVIQRPERSEPDKDDMER
jgi:hypothetical protein